MWVSYLLTKGNRVMGGGHGPLSADVKNLGQAAYLILEAHDLKPERFTFAHKNNEEVATGRRSTWKLVVSETKEGIQL
jgi:hypothetical protein